MSYVKERVYKESEIARAYNAQDPAVSTIVATLMNSTRLKIEGKLKDRACGIMLKDLKKSFKMNVDNVVADNPEVESISSDYGELLMAKVFCGVLGCFSLQHRWFFRNIMMNCYGD